MKNTILPILLLCGAFIFSGCEKDDEPLIEESQFCQAYIDGIFQDVDLQTIPEYLNGGMDGFLEALLSTIKYPASAREAGVQGICIVHYEITETGEVENITIIEDPGSGIGDATVDALVGATQGVAFSPGVYDFQVVRVKKELPVSFKLE